MIVNIELRKFLKKKGPTTKVKNLGHLKHHRFQQPQIKD